MANIKWLAQPKLGEGWSLWSDLHRRLAVYETAPVAAEAQRQMVSATGLAPVTSTFARWRSDLTELRGQMALSAVAQC